MKNLFLLLIIVALASPGLPFEEGDKVVMYWDSSHSLSKNEHSLANWLEGKTASAFINIRGEIEITLDIAGFPHVLSSPELNLDCESFDAIKITYVNLLDSPEAEKIKIAVGWVDEAGLDKYRKGIYTKYEERFITLPLERNGHPTAILKFKGHEKWQKGAKIVGLNLGFMSELDTAKGKILINSIELVKFNE